MKINTTKISTASKIFEDQVHQDPAAKITTTPPSSSPPKSSPPRSSKINQLKIHHLKINRLKIKHLKYTAGRPNKSHAIVRRPCLSDTLHMYHHGGRPRRHLSAWIRPRARARARQSAKTQECNLMDGPHQVGGMLWLRWISMRFCVRLGSDTEVSIIMTLLRAPFASLAMARS